VRLASAASAGLIAALAAASLAGAAAASPPPAPANLRVDGPGGAWRADNSFRLSWDPAAAVAEPLTVGYVVRDPTGAVVSEDSGIPAEALTIDHVRVAPLPGEYTAEVWLEGSGGEAGPASTAALRFDDLAPGPARPDGLSGWLPATEPAILRIGHPPGPLPLSGIRGYAISVDRGSGGAPCAQPTRCTAAETDLDGGVGDDTTSLGTLPEGTNYARAVAVSGAGVPSQRVESVAVRVDGTVPAVRLDGAPEGWARRPVRLTATATDPLSGMAASGPAGPFTAISVDGAPPALALGDTASVSVRGDGMHRIAFFARDGAGNVADGQLGSPQPQEAVLRIDETAPRVSFADAQDPSDPERIEASVADALSGVDPDHGAIGIRPAGSSLPFERLPTAVSGDRLLARWDSDAYPDGGYEFRATGYDRAGNGGGGNRRADGTPMVLANPVKEPTAVESGFGGRRLVWQRCERGPDGRRCHREVIEGYEDRPSARRVPCGRSTAFGGRLLSSAGAPLPGLPVTVVETFAAGSVPSRRETTLRTSPDGTFLARLPAGPSRQVEAYFGGTPILTRAEGRPVRLGVASAVGLRASSASVRVGGAPVLFSGRLGHLDSRIPAGGMPVQLQYRLPGSGWTDFRTVQTNASGRFRYPYAFSDDDSRGVRFQFRAYLSAPEGWPYESAASTPVIVTGR
jgi:hypothetical protein